MDYSILIAIILVALAIGLPLGFKKLKDMGKVDSESLSFVINLFKLSNQIVNELDLKQEKQINEITEIVLLSLNYVYNMENFMDKENIAINYCIDMCEEMNIEINQNRIEIIENLIHMGMTDNSK